MNYLVVEDQAQPICNLLSAIETEDAKQLFRLPWNRIIRQAEQMYSKGRPDLPPDCQFIVESNYVLGVRRGSVSVLVILNDQTLKHAITWIGNNLPNPCLSFMDYTLGNVTAAPLVHLLARSHLQLCAESSSTTAPQGIDVMATLGGRAQFYLSTRYRGMEPESATMLVRKAREFWDKNNGTFTGLMNVDSVIGLFVRGQQEHWDGDPFEHDHLQVNAGRVAVTRENLLAALPALADLVTRLEGDGRSGDADTLVKALFQCRKGTMQRCHQTQFDCKGLPVLGLQWALRFLDIPDTLVQAPLPKMWVPPFRPSIVFLCHLRLMMDAFGGHNRRKPKLSFHGCAMNQPTHTGGFGVKFTFEESIQADPNAGNKGLANWQNSTASDCFSLMRAAHKSHFGKTDWRTTPAWCIVSLLQPENERLAVSVDENANEVGISWEVQL